MKILSAILLAFTLLAGSQLTFAAQKKDPTLPLQKQEYSANVKTQKYHKPGCKFYDCRDCTRFFKTPGAARKAGFEPCKVCGG